MPVGTEASQTSIVGWPQKVYFINFISIIKSKIQTYKGKNTSKKQIKQYKIILLIDEIAILTPKCKVPTTPIDMKHQMLASPSPFFSGTEVSIP